jgi:hypothetical protein
MSFVQKLIGWASGNGAEVNSSNELLAVTNKTRSSTTVFYENDDGTKTGTAYLKSPEVSADYRLRVGLDTILFTDTFNATAQNTGNWKHAFATMTMTQSAGFLNVNAAGTSTASGNYAYLQSWRYFPLIGTAPIAVEFTGQFTNYPTTNEIFQAGVGVATGAAEPIAGRAHEQTEDREEDDRGSDRHRQHRDPREVRQDQRDEIEHPDGDAERRIKIRDKDRSHR